MLAVSGRDVLMTPSGITWEATPLEVGTLYLPGLDEEADLHTAELLKNDPRGELLGEGKNGGSVYLPPEGEPQDLVIKEFGERIVCMQDIANRGDLATMRANFMLAFGLDTLDQSKAAWRFQGVKLLGALTFNSGHAPRAGLHARWVMKRVMPVDNALTSDYMPTGYHDMVMDNNGALREGRFRARKAPEKPSMPSVKKRQTLYAQALEAAGATGSITMSPDDHVNNMLIERIPVRRRRKIVTQGLATKIDVLPVSGFDF